MNLKFKDNNEEVAKAVENLEISLHHLQYSIQNINSINTIRKINNISKQISLLIPKVEPEEINFLKNLKEQKRIKMLAQNESYRTSYNQNVDGRIQGAYYSGQGDMGKRKNK